MGSRSPRPRAADDFAVIRARMEELRRERAQLPADDELPRSIGPRPYAIASRSDPRDRRLSPEASQFIRRLFRTA
jgi:hypothetical protein